MAKTAQQAINEALADLGDAAGNTWDPTTFMLPRVGDALAAIVELVPQANQVRENLTLTAGVSLQSVPADVVRIVDVVRNMGADGATPGRAITLVTKSQMDAVKPDWHESRLATEVRHWVYDVERPTFFWVYPRPRDAIRIEAVNAKVPTPPGALVSDIPIGDRYFNAIVAYLKYRAWDRAGDRRNVEKSNAAYAMFKDLLGVNDASDQRQDPKRKNP